ncbi:MAG: aldolase/citrate lyase family protein [Acidobacteria bacterium]|nr:aldolase/citrate lyase family protein [Acidobacteriota bacterium]
MSRRNLGVLLVVVAWHGGSLAAPPQHDNVILDLWAKGQPAFGVYAPAENRSPRGQTPPPGPARPPYSREGAERLAANPLYDFVFLNLEGGYDPAHVTVMVEGLRSPAAVSRKTLIVRIPPISSAGADVTKARVKEILDAGADGVTLPHVRSVEEAKLAISFFTDAGASVWSPSNPRGEKLAMLMLEDPGALAQAAAIADLPGYSILACGIGSLRAALGGNAAAAEAGTQKVLVESRRAKLANMLTATAADIAPRVEQGFLALLMQGAQADATIKLGRAAAKR